MTTRRRISPPSYRLHKSSGQAIVVLDGRMIYLGSYDTPESHRRYRRELADWLAQGATQASPHQSAAPATQPESVQSMNEIILAFTVYAQTY